MIWMVGQKTEIPTVESGKNNNSTKYFKFWTGTPAQGVGISQKVKLVAGSYVLTAEINGENKLFPLSAIIKDTNTEYIRENTWLE